MHYDAPPSVWKLSELLTWQDLGFIPNTDNTDVENYCSFMGAYEICSMFRGVIPVVHGSVGCVSSYYATRIATRLADRVKPLPFGTCMDAGDAIFGAMDKLIKAVRDIDQLYHPRLIVVLTTCVPDMIAEDTASLEHRLGESVDADILVIPAGGLSCKGFREGGDLAFRALMDYVARKAKPTPVAERRGVNLFLRRVHGKLSDAPDVAELQRLLAHDDIPVNSIIRIGATYDDLLRIPQARANLSLCYTYGKSVLADLEQRFAQPASPVSYPVGLTGTLDWVAGAARAVGVADTLPQSGEVEAVRRRTEGLREELARALKVKKMFIWQPGEKALAFVKLAKDLDLEPVLIGFTYHMLKQTRETVVQLLNAGHDPTAIIRGHSKLWTEYETTLAKAARPMLVMPKRFWLGELPCVDLNLFAEPILGLSGIERVYGRIARAYAGETSSVIFDRYIERRYQKVEFVGGAS